MNNAFCSLLVPVDLSPSSDRVVGRALSLPVAPGGSVMLLHIVPGHLSTRARREAERDAQKALISEELHASKVLGPDVTVSHSVSVGAPASKIADFASRLKADLIVMGRGGGRPLRDSFLGSTAERVIRQGPTPVLVVRLPPRGPYRRPALGLDLDHSAEGALGMLFRAIANPGRVTIIHAHDAPYLGMIYASLSADQTANLDRHVRQTAAAQLALVLGRALEGQKSAAGGHPKFTTYVRHGDARTVIKAAVKKLDTDLLLLGTRGHTRAAQVFLGTVAGDLLRDVRCDVLVVPPRRSRARRG